MDEWEKRKDTSWHWDSVVMLIMILGFAVMMVAIGVSCVHRDTEEKRSNADPSQCRPKTVVINHEWSHDLEDLELRHCRNVAHRWHVEQGTVVCTCEGK